MAPWVIVGVILNYITHTHVNPNGFIQRSNAAAARSDDSDGKVLTFEFLDLAGPTKYSHLKQTVFTFITDNHHIEEWN